METTLLPHWRRNIYLTNAGGSAIFTGFSLHNCDRQHARRTALVSLLTRGKNGKL